MFNHGTLPSITHGLPRPMRWPPNRRSRNSLFMAMRYVGRHRRSQLGHRRSWCGDRRHSTIYPALTGDSALSSVYPYSMTRSLRHVSFRVVAVHTQGPRGHSHAPLQPADRGHLRSMDQAVHLLPRTWISLTVRSMYATVKAARTVW